MAQKTYTDGSGDVVNYEFDERNPEVQRALSLGIPLERSERFIRRNQGDYGRLVSSVGGDEAGKLYPAASGGSGGNVAQQWTQSSAAAPPAQDPRAEALYQQLLGRSQQGLGITRNDPTIRAQADAYGANEERAKRNYLSDTAEQAGPYANLQGERRMASERQGQRTGSFEAELMGRELTSRRQEIAQALTSMQGMLSADQQAGLMREMAALDAAIKREGLAVQKEGQSQQQDSFLRELALREWKYGDDSDLSWAGL